MELLSSTRAPAAGCVPGTVYKFLQFLNSHPAPHNNIVLRKALRGEIPGNHIARLENHILQQELAFISHSDGHITYSLTPRGLEFLDTFEQRAGRVPHSWLEQVRGQLFPKISALIHYS